jgi:hypothetical protein
MINDKFEEQMKLQEYITMEEEKLIEAKRTFKDDCNKFNVYME